MIERIEELEIKLAKSEDNKRRDNTYKDFSLLDEEDEDFNDSSESIFEYAEDDNKFYDKMETWEAVTVMVPVDASSCYNDTVVSLSQFKGSEI